MSWSWWVEVNRRSPNTTDAENPSIGPSLHLSAYHPAEATWGSISAAAAVVFAAEYPGTTAF